MHGSENAEVNDDHDSDKQPQQNEEFALREEVRFASFVNEFRNVAHGLMHGHPFEAAINSQAEDKAEHAKHDAEQKQLMPIDPKKSNLRKIGHFQRSFTAGFLSHGGGARKKAQKSSRGKTFSESTSQGPGTRKPGAHQKSSMKKNRIQ